MPQGMTTRQNWLLPALARGVFAHKLGVAYMDRAPLPVLKR